MMRSPVSSCNTLPLAREPRAVRPSTAGSSAAAAASTKASLAPVLASATSSKKKLSNLQERTGPAADGGGGEDVASYRVQKWWWFATAITATSGSCSSPSDSSASHARRCCRRPRTNRENARCRKFLTRYTAVPSDRLDLLTFGMVSLSLVGGVIQLAALGGEDAEDAYRRYLGRVACCHFSLIAPVEPRQPRNTSAEREGPRTHGLSRGSASISTWPDVVPTVTAPCLFVGVRSRSAAYDGGGWEEGGRGSLRLSRLPFGSSARCSPGKSRCVPWCPTKHKLHSRRRRSPAPKDGRERRRDEARADDRAVRELGVALRRILGKRGEARAQGEGLRDAHPGTRGGRGSVDCQVVTAPFVYLYLNNSGSTLAAAAAGRGGGDWLRGLEWTGR
ncbi:hypothetical protein ACHAWF_001764 [Thalassiosira exigua]